MEKLEPNKEKRSPEFCHTGEGGYVSKDLYRK